MSEPYEGDIMHQCPVRPFAFQHTRAVIVSGYGINLCGHCILYTGDGWYFHVAEPYDVPRFMREDGYMRYLHENGKHEIRRWVVKIPNPAAAHAKLEELLTKK